MNNINIAISILLTLFVDPLNSFHIKTPQSAATIGAPCPKPYEIAGPAFSAAI